MESHWCSACRGNVDAAFFIAQHNIACAERGERSYLANRVTMPARTFPYVVLRPKPAPIRGAVTMALREIL